MDLRNSSIDLRGKVALVTDIASDHGFHLAQGLLHAGARVHAVNPDHGECVRQTEELRRFGHAIGHAVDLRDGAALMHFAQLISEQVPRLSILVGTLRLACTADSTEVAEAKVLEKYDLLGDLFLVQQLVASLRDGSTATDPARVILVGGFEPSRSAESRPSGRGAGLSFASLARDISQRFVEQRINLNFVDAHPDRSESAPTVEGPVSLLDSVLQFAGVATAHVRGQVIAGAPVIGSSGHASFMNFPP